MKTYNIFQRFFTFSAILFGILFVAFLVSNPSTLAWAASDPVSGPITPTPTPPVSSPITPTPAPLDIIIDNTNSGFSTTGTWTVGSTGTGYVGSNYLYAGKQQGKKSARWSPNLPGGQYKVSVRYGSGSWATKVQYIVSSPAGLQTFYVNQSINSGQWVELGTFQFNSTSPTYVEVKNNTKGTIVADAARFQEVH